MLSIQPKIPRNLRLGQMLQKLTWKSSRKSRNFSSSEKQTIQPKLLGSFSNGTEI